jgi:hypothetical protein
MYVVSWDNIGEIERLSHLGQQVVFIVFSNGTGASEIAILPE